MALEEQLLTASLVNTFHEANDILQRLYSLGPQDTLKQVETTGEDYDQAISALAYYVEKAFRDVGILAERLGLPLLRTEIAEARARINNLTERTPLHDDGTFHSEPLQTAREYFDSLQTMTLGRDITGLGVFENILQNAAVIIKARKLEPKNEKEIRNSLREVLGFAFPDVVKEIPIEKSLKVYRPDIGVTSLMAAAEVKFATTRQEANAALDGIYADMKGYGGRDEWRSFYAVIYMTEAFYTQRDVEREFRLVKAELSWTPFVVWGPGARKKKAP
jgi:hypothetical protein